MMLVPDEAIGCRARVLYDMGHWHCGWVVSYKKSGVEGRAHIFQLRMDDGDYEEVLLPSPDGDVEIIPGFRKKFLAGQHHCWLEDNFVRREKGMMGRDVDAASGAVVRTRVKGELDNEGKRGELLTKGGASSWNRFLVQKKGLGLNRAQLQTLYKAQMQSREMLKAKNANNLFKAGPKRDRRKDSSWNYFLKQRKGLGLTRVELKGM